MPSPSTALLVLALLPARPAVAEPPSPPSCEAGVRYMELVADAPGEPPEVCIRPGLTTTFLLDSKRVRVELAGRERFRQLLEGRHFLTLVPSDSLRDGERIPVTFHFEDGAAPERATFMLVLHPSQAERQVEVSRHPRPVASYRREAQQALAEARQCREEKARLQAECRGRVGLAGVMAHRLVGPGGVPSRDISKEITGRPGDSLTPARVHSYRSTTDHLVEEERIVRLAVRLELVNKGTEPWMAESAALVGPQGEAPRVLEVWQPEPIPPGEWRPVVVEVELTEREARGPFTLKLWTGEGAGRSVTFDGITFP